MNAAALFLGLSPGAFAQALLVFAGVLALGSALAGAALAVPAMDRYMAADRAETLQLLDFNDTAAAWDQVRDLSEAERVDLILEWDAMEQEAAALEERVDAMAVTLPGDAVVMLPQPDADGNACSCARSDRLPLEAAC